MSYPLQLDRRTLLRSLLCLSGAALLPGAALALASGLHAPLAARRPGELDIHHIDTGRGNCTLIVAPDGTTIMIDAGASIGNLETTSAARPDTSRRPGEWQARYALRHSGSDHLDYFIATHIHPDHVGDVDEHSPADGAYQLTGISDVDRLMPIGKVIDRAYPDYSLAPHLDAPFARNYVAYLKHRVDAGQPVERANVGSDRQIVARQAGSDFKVRILSANASVWTGSGAESASQLPDISKLPRDEQPNENIFSVALRLSYGRFSYFTGGDLASDTRDGALPWMDVESPVARAAGRTEVAAANHHGYFDACGPEFAKRLDAQAYIIQAWDIGHPGSAQMQRMLGQWGQQAKHDVFATDLLPANQLMNRRFAPQLKSQRGHVVVRVANGGDSYRIFVLDSSNETANVTAAFGPYLCRS